MDQQNQPQETPIVTEPTAPAPPPVATEPATPTPPVVEPIQAEPASSVAETVAVEPQAVDAAPAPVPSPVSASSSAMKRILLVEDDEGLASVYVARLEAEDFDVRHVPNGEEALSNAIEYKPDMILLDVMMPKISGFDVLDILRNTPETTNIKIIMLTALSQQKDKERAQSLGVDDYLVKSQVVIADVVDRVKFHLGVV